MDKVGCAQFSIGVVADEVRASFSSQCVERKKKSRKAEQWRKLAERIRTAEHKHPTSPAQSHRTAEKREPKRKGKSVPKQFCKKCHLLTQDTAALSRGR